MTTTTSAVAGAALALVDEPVFSQTSKPRSQGS